MKLGTLIKTLSLYDESKEVEFDFGYMVPTTLDSWRGVYSELALGYEYAKHDRPTVRYLLEECRSAVGKTFEGWKGGDFIMGENTNVYIDNPGEWSSTSIIAVTEVYGTVTIVTAKIEK